MKITLAILILVLSLSGCSTYKFHRGQGPSEQGYVVSRDNYKILEYTQGKDGITADLPLAEKRFKRRKPLVEDYYKKMGYIENNFKEAFLDPPVYFLGFIAGLFRMPFIAVSIYRYEHNPRYRAKKDKIKDEEYAREEARIASLKAQLGVYIQKDLFGETFTSETAVLPKQQESSGFQAESAPLKDITNVVVKDETQGLTPAEKPLSKVKADKGSSVTALIAVIIANPQKGPSPLTVKFSGSKSYSAHAKIISYEWNFGDGDTSRKKNAVNTFLSATYGVRHFNVTLTVSDDHGASASAQKAIEVVSQ